MVRICVFAAMPMATGYPLKCECAVCYSAPWDKKMSNAERCSKCARKVDRKCVGAADDEELICQVCQGTSNSGLCHLLPRSWQQGSAGRRTEVADPAAQVSTNAAHSRIFSNGRTRNERNRISIKQLSTLEEKDQILKWA
jgi:hypothetical protein